MKCKFTFSVNGFFKFPVGINFQIDNYHYEFQKLENNKINLIVTISNYPITYIPKISKNINGKSKATITFPSNPIQDDIISNIRTFEGVMSIWGMKEIDTDNYTIEWIPESDYENSQIHIYNFSKYIEEDPNSFYGAPYDLFIRSLLSISNLKSIETPLNFYRRGFLDFRSEKYIDAIYDLYFVFETLFANGKFHKSQVKKEFYKSTIINESIDYIKNNIDKSISFKKHLFQEFEKNYLNKTNKEIIDHFVDLRGFLHHHTLKRIDIWHPSKQREYQVDALTLMNMCHHILMKMAIDIIFKKDIKEKIKTLKIRTDDGRNVKNIIQQE